MYEFGWRIVYLEVTNPTNIGTSMSLLKYLYTFTSVLCVCVCVFFQENVFTQISDLQLEEQFENFLDGSVLLLVCVLHTNVISV